ncbi:hypothetical protein EJ05DRAFT_473631 [Pseudovirgaria hyperparasitica]|uniref:Uncharacterized protein n=1 Tax=Pseudovirgaria hyperparasitica TaxID=470096 RepID=A0A6A6WFV9_9PEZI|nr:uncharacterized protein EJ05DRAFT_473631 [Pseudovirgaria hyperparasitica]KAF2761069.1 hypothetical protein EJ05DRAFT_473631 [Pseudovirgaria hyperparasitica]
MKLQLSVFALVAALVAPIIPGAQALNSDIVQVDDGARQLTSSFIAIGKGDDTSADPGTPICLGDSQACGKGCCPKVRVSPFLLCIPLD